jgi:hypothetical protein
VTAAADPATSVAEERFLAVANGAKEHGVIRESVREKED